MNQTCVLSLWRLWEKWICPRHILGKSKFTWPKAIQHGLIFFHDSCFHDSRFHDSCFIFFHDFFTLFALRETASIETAYSASWAKRQVVMSRLSAYEFDREFCLFKLSYTVLLRLVRTAFRIGRFRSFTRAPTPASAPSHPKLSNALPLTFEQSVSD